MSGFDYGNARVRAMKSHLLSRRDMEELMEARSLEDYITMLSKTSYHRSIETALVRSSYLESITHALRQDFSDCVVKIRGFYKGSEQGLLDRYLKIYDIFNLIAVLRGVSTQANPPVITDMLLPAVALPESILRELTRAENIHQIVDILASVNSIYAPPLMVMRSKKPDGERFQLEIALLKWYYKQALEGLDPGSDVQRPLLDILKLEADILNLITVIHIVDIPESYQTILVQMGADEFADLMVEEGTLKLRQLQDAAESSDLFALYRSFSGTTYERAFEEGWSRFQQTRRASELEKALNRYKLAKLAGYTQSDPLGIGLVIGYLTLKMSEGHNLRWIAQGVYWDISPVEINAELEQVR
jgi:V/A-type H+-transporting ATPase subunit C